MPTHPLFFLDVFIVKPSLLFEIFSTLPPPPLTSKDFLVTSLLSKRNFLKDTFYFIQLKSERKSADFSYFNTQLC